MSFTHLDVRLQAALISSAIGLVVAVVNSIVTLKVGDKNEKVSKENADKAADTALKIGEKNIKSLEQRRLIDAISMQRIEWMNKLRDKFVSFNELAAKRKILLKTNYSVYIKQREKIDDEINENTVQLFTVKSNIELFLNPNEFFSEQLSIYLAKMIDIFSNNKTIYDDRLYRETADTIHFIEQVILKAEWYRIKDETEKGEQIDEVEMAKIFDKVANKIDSDRYQSLKKGESWLKFEKMINQ